MRDNKVLGKSELLALLGLLVPLKNDELQKLQQPFHPQPPVQKRTTVPIPCHPQKAASGETHGKPRTHLHLLGQQNSSSQTPYLNQSLVQWEAETAFQVPSDSNFHHLGRAHLYVRHLQSATQAGNISVALEQEVGVTASPWLKSCVVILPRLNWGFCNVNALPGYYLPKMKTRPMLL